MNISSSKNSVKVISSTEHILTIVENFTSKFTSLNIYRIAEWVSPLSFSSLYLEIINNSDFVIFYVKETNESGAYKAMQYAIKEKKKLVNIAWSLLAH